MKGGETVTEEQKNFIENNSASFTYKELSEKTGLTIKACKEFIKKEGLPRKGGPLASIELNFIEKNLSIMTPSEMAKHLGRSYELILKNIKKQGWHAKGMKNSFNQDFFENIDTEEKAYFLGLLFADGYILCGRKEDGRVESDAFGISLQEQDIDILKKLKTALNATHPINIYENSGSWAKKGTYYGRIICYSQKAVNDLYAKGMKKHKTFDMQFPTEEQVPHNLLHHFIRGYVDGDGSIGAQKNRNKHWFTTMGTKEFLTGMQHFFGTDVKLGQRYPERENNNYELRYCGNRQIDFFLDILYRDATIYMDRKYKTYQLLKAKYSES